MQILSIGKSHCCLHPLALSLCHLAIFTQITSLLNVYLINSPAHSIMCAKCQEDLQSGLKHWKPFHCRAVVWNVFKMLLWILPNTSPVQVMPNFFYIYNIAYKPFVKRSWIYLCPTALQRTHFFFLLHRSQRHCGRKEKKLRSDAKIQQRAILHVTAAQGSLCYWILHKLWALIA